MSTYKVSLPGVGYDFISAYCAIEAAEKYASKKNYAGKVHVLMDEEEIIFVIKSFTERMREAADIIDPSDSHKKMDDLMCQKLKDLGCDDAVKIFEQSDKWYE